MDLHGLLQGYPFFILVLFSGVPPGLAILIESLMKMRQLIRWLLAGDARCVPTRLVCVSGGVMESWVKIRGLIQNM
jgi:hypothetical protein